MGNKKIKKNHAKEEDAVYVDRIKNN